MDKSIDTENLAELLSAVAAGDMRAFNTIYGATAGLCYARVMRIVQDTETARDVLQMAYVSIWKNAGKFDRSKGSALAWMSTVMRNRALDAVRARARMPVSELIDDALPDEQQQAESRAEASLLSRLLEEHLKHLPSDVVTALRLNIVEGWTCQEIGDYLKISRNTVKSRVRRGLLRLRDDLPFSDLHQLI